MTDNVFHGVHAIAVFLVIKHPLIVFSNHLLAVFLFSPKPIRKKI